MNDCCWKSESCGALALRWGSCDKVKPSCLPKSAYRLATPPAVVDTDESKTQDGPAVPHAD